jgi:hypothetical protein
LVRSGISRSNTEKYPQNPRIKTKKPYYPILGVAYPVSGSNEEPASVAKALLLGIFSGSHMIKYLRPNKILIV